MDAKRKAAGVQPPSIPSFQIRFKFNQYGKDLAAVNAWIEPLRTELAKVGLPVAIHSTAWTLDWNNRPVQAADGTLSMPPGLENHAFPADFWLQPVSGEFLMGLSKYNANPAHDVAVLANHNAYAPQEVTLQLSRPVQPAIFDRSSRTYRNLALRNGLFSLTLEPAGAAIVIFKPR